MLAEVITAAVRAVDGEGAPAPGGGDTLAQGEGPTDAAQAACGPHSEQRVGVEAPCGVASEKGSAEAEAGGEAAEAGGEAAEAGGDMQAAAAEVEDPVRVVTPAPAVAEAEAEQTDADPKDVPPTE